MCVCLSVAPQLGFYCAFADIDMDTNALMLLKFLCHPLFHTAAVHLHRPDAGQSDGHLYALAEGEGAAQGLH